MSVAKILNQVLTDPRHHDFLVPARLLRNGVVYGGRIRFAHAIVMSLLFKHGPLDKKITLVFRATWAHAKALGLFALLFKAFKNILNNSKMITQPGGFKIPLVADNVCDVNTFIAGALGLYVVYSHQFPQFSPAITQQVTLYCFSRVVLAAGNMIAARVGNAKGVNDLHASRIEAKLQRRLWAWFSVLTWGVVMWMHAYEPDKLQPSLHHSMQYIYENNKWSDWYSFLMVGA